MQKKRFYQEFFDVKTLEDQPLVTIERLVPRDVFHLEADDITLASGVLFKIRFTGHPYRVESMGRLKTRLRMDCDRCLEPFERTIRVKFHTLHLPASEMPDRSSRITQEEDFFTAYFTNERIDIWHMIHEQILLQIPIKRLCRSDCRGLCSTCGVNRNLTDCSCEAETIDPRWEPLQKLLKSLS